MRQQQQHDRGGGRKTRIPWRAQRACVTYVEQTHYWWLFCRGNGGNKTTYLCYCSYVTGNFCLVFGAIYMSAFLCMEVDLALCPSCSGTSFFPFSWKLSMRWASSLGRNHATFSSRMRDSCFFRPNTSQRSEPSSTGDLLDIFGSIWLYCSYR